MPYFQKQKIRETKYRRVNLGDGLPEIVSTIIDNKDLISSTINTGMQLYDTAQEFNPNKVVKEIADKKEELKKLKEIKTKIKNKNKEINDTRSKLNEEDILKIQTLAKSGQGFVKF